MGKRTEESFEAAIARIGEAYSKAMLTSDVELCMSLWDEDGMQLPPDHPMVVGRQAIRESFTHTFQSLRYTSFKVTPCEGAHAGGIGYACANYTYSFRRAPGGEEVTREGKNVAIIRRQPDGSWKLHIDCFNLNAPAR